MKSCVLNAWRSVVVLVVRVDVASKKSALSSEATLVIVISKPDCVDNVIGNLNSSPGEYIYVYSGTSSINHLKLDRSDILHVICTVVGQMLPFNGAGMVDKEADETPEHNTSA